MKSQIVFRINKEAKDALARLAEMEKTELSKLLRKIVSDYVENAMAGETDDDESLCGWLCPYDDEELETELETA